MSKEIKGPSPMDLSYQCVTCGGDTVSGRRVEKVIYYVPPWTYVGLFIGLIVCIILQYAFRKPLHLAYSLCADCERRRKIKKSIAIGIWVAFGVSIVAGFYRPAALWLSLLLCIAGCVGSALARYPLRVVGYDEPFFRVKGFGGAFFQRGGRQLNGYPTRGPWPGYQQQPAQYQPGHVYQAAPAYQQVPQPYQPAPVYQPPPVYGQAYDQPPAYQPVYAPAPMQAQGGYLSASARSAPQPGQTHPAGAQSQPNQYPPPPG